jgi:hypothetical protein
VLDPEGADADVVLRQKLWEQTIKHLTGFPGQTSEIEGRQYFSWADYLKWRGRRVKGDFRSGLRQGLVVSHWNQRARSESLDNMAILDGVKVGELECLADVNWYQVCHNGDVLAEMLLRRENLLVSVDSGKTCSEASLKLHCEAHQWREMARDYVGELYALKQGIASIEQRYFDGHPALFPGSTQALLQVVDLAGKLVIANNRGSAADLKELDVVVDGSDAQGSEIHNRIDLLNLHRGTQGAATDQFAHLVDMAKAETLDSMGE